MQDTPVRHDAAHPAGAHAEAGHTHAARGRDDLSEAAVRRVKSNPHLFVRAHELKLNEERAGSLKRIADTYFQHAHVRLVATGGTRTPLRQAQLMVGKFRHGDDVAALYENTTALAEIRKAYDDGKAAHRTFPQIDRAIAAILDAQVARGVYISRHLQFGAVDIRSRGMSTAQEAAFRAAVASETGVILLDERNGPEPHFHLTL